MQFDSILVTGADFARIEQYGSVDVANDNLIGSLKTGVLVGVQRPADDRIVGVYAHGVMLVFTGEAVFYNKHNGHAPSNDLYAGLNMSGQDYSQRNVIGMM